ncbi:MAG: hypothetical protein ABJC24_00365 [Chloroflexota bacterium]
MAKRLTVAKGLGLLMALGLIALAILMFQRPQDPIRHTLSHGSSLVTFDAAGTVWGRRSFVREIWVAPDGSGRIDERDDSLTFPNDTERAEWVALGSPATPAISRSFGPGELSYVRLDRMSRDPRELLGDMTAGGAKPTDTLRMVALLLYENVPPTDLTHAVVGALRQVPGVEVEDRGNLVIFTGTDETSTGRAQGRIVIDVSTGQLVSEERYALGALPGLSVEPPIVMLERWIDATDLTAVSRSLAQPMGRMWTDTFPAFGLREKVIQPTSGLLCMSSRLDHICG